MDLEPRERDPAAERKTIFILVSVMIVGAFFVLSAYKKREAAMDPDRPPISARLKKNLGAKNQDGKVVSLSIFENKVWFAAPLCVSQLDENKHAIEMIKTLEEHYRGNDKVGFALISIDGVDMGVGPEELKVAAKELGIDTERIVLLTTGDTNKQRGYIKDQLRLGVVSERKAGEAGGKWKFPSQIVMVDQGMHIRQRYDLREVYSEQKRAEEALAKDPQLLNEEGFKKYLNLVDDFWKTVHTNIEYVLAEVSVGSKE